MKKIALFLILFVFYKPLLAEPIKEVSITWQRLPLVNFSANGIDAKVIFKGNQSLPQADEYAFIREMLIEKLTKAECTEENIIFCISEIKKSLSKSLCKNPPSEISLYSQSCYSQPYLFALSFSLLPENTDVSFTIDFTPSPYGEDNWSDLHLKFQAKVNSSAEYWKPSELYTKLSNHFKELWQSSQGVDGFSQTFLNLVCNEYPFFKEVNFQVSGKKISDHEDIEDVSVLCKHPSEFQQVS